MQFDTRISWADLVAILTGIGVLATVVFGVQTDVEMNAQNIEANKEAFQREIKRVDDNANKDRKEILDRLDETKSSMETIRVESSAGRLRIEDKLDTLTERLLNQ